jgi:hypothetical protein
MREFHSKEFSVLRDAINAHMSALKKLEAVFSGANLTNTAIRNEPVCILLRGQSGSGKTYATQILAAHAMVKYFEKHDPSQLPLLKQNFGNFLYARNHEQQYWDGYREQFTTIIDDFGQAVTAPGSPDDEWMNFIRMAGIFGYNLHMAALEQKGKVNFASKLIICSTNLFNFTPQSIVQVEAVERRFDIVVDVVPKKEYCTQATRDSGDVFARRLDRSHPKLVNREFTTDIYEFRLMRFIAVNKAEFVEVLTWDQLVDLIDQKMDSSYHAGDNYLRYVNAFVSQKVDSLNFKPQMNSTLDDMIKIAPQEDISSFSQAVSEMIAEVNELESKNLISPQNDLTMLTIDEILEAVPITKVVQVTYDCLESSDKITIERMFFPEEHCELGYILAAVCQVDPRLGEVALRGRNALLMYLKYASESSQLFQIQSIARTMMYGTSNSWKKSLSDAKLKISSWFSHLTTYFQSIEEKYPWAPTVAKVLGGMAATYAAYAALNALFSDDEEQKDEEDDARFLFTPEFDSGTNGKGKSEKSRKRERTHLKLFKPEGGMDQNTEELIMKVLKRNMYNIKSDISGIRLGSVVFVKGNTALVPEHYRREFKRICDQDPARLETTICLENAFIGKDKKVTIPIKRFFANDVIIIPNQDMCVMNFPTLPQHPDITKFFVTRAEFDRVRVFQNMLMVNLGNDVPTKYVFPHVSLLDKVTVRPDNMDEYMVSEGLMYKCPTQNGDCGSLLMFYNSVGGPGRFIGLHVAGSHDAWGMSSVIVKEDLDKAILPLCPYDQPFPETLLLKPQCDSIPLTGNFAPFALAEKPLVPAMTRLRKSPLYGAWKDATTAPAALCRFKNAQGVTIDPFRNAIEPYGRAKSDDFDEEMFKIGMQSYAAFLHNNTNLPHRRPLRVYTFEEAILGITGVRHAKSLPRNTSMGYPYNMEPHPGKPGKTRFFGDGDEYDLSNVDCVVLKRDVLACIADANAGIRWLHVYCDFLKDERRKHEKVVNGKTRMISGSPLILTIAGRMLFMDFFVWMQENKLFNGVGLGMDPHSADWNLLYRLMMQVGPKCIDGDYVGFDTAHHARAMTQFAPFVNSFYNDSYSTARKILCLDVTYSIHLFYRVIYQWMGALPSGAFNTPFLNSILNNIYIRGCYAKMHPSGPQGIESFDENVKAVCFGDDNLMNVSPNVSSWFNLPSLIKCMPIFNQTYGSAIKGEVNPPNFRPLDKVTFLKRQFRWVESLDTCLAPLELDVILEMPYWYHETFGNDHEFIIRTNVEVALMELAVHEKSIFDEWAPKIIKESVSRLQFYPTLTDYHLLQRKWMATREDW